MGIRILSLLVMCAALAASAPAAGQASHLDLGSAIEKAARQRMLSQRALKCYAQLVENVSPQAARTQLAELVVVFDDQVADLKAFTAQKGIPEAAAEVERQWVAVRALALGTPTHDGAVKLRAATNLLLEAAERNVKAISGLAGAPVSPSADLAGRQRMLSQRLAAYHLMLGMDVERPELLRAIEDDSAAFARALAELRALPQNSAEIATELDAVAEQWGRLQPLLGSRPGYAGNRATVLAIADTILNRVDRAAGFYRQAASR